jgi:hypothetical protein
MKMPVVEFKSTYNCSEGQATLTSIPLKKAGMTCEVIIKLNWLVTNSEPFIQENKMKLFLGVD